MANDDLLKLLEFSLAQPVSTAVADELPNMSRQQVSSTESPEYILREDNAHGSIDNLINMNDLKQLKFGGLSEDELLDIVMSVTPMGSVGAGKGIMSTLKSLLGRAKWKFPVGYGEPTKGMSIADRKMLDKFLEKRKLSEVLSRIDNPGGSAWTDKMLGRTPSKGTVEWMELQKAFYLGKPKGMRQFGKFNRPLGKHGNKPK